jgi:cold shock CspA family protein
MMLHPGHHVLAMMQALLNSYISTLYAPHAVKQLADDLFACCKDLNDVLDHTSYPTLLTQWIICGTKIRPDIAQSTDTTECIQSNVHKLSMWILDMRMNLLMSFTSKLFNSDNYEKIYNVLTFTNRLQYDEQMTSQVEQAMTEYRAAYRIQATEQPVMGEHLDIQSGGIACQWHHANGYGFITPMEGGKDIYVPRSAIVDGDYLRKGDIVQFQATWSSRGYQATSVYGGVHHKRDRRHSRSPSPCGSRSRSRSPSPSRLNFMSDIWVTKRGADQLLNNRGELIKNIRSQHPKVNITICNPLINGDERKIILSSNVSRPVVDDAIDDILRYR